MYDQPTPAGGGPPTYPGPSGAPAGTATLVPERTPPAAAVARAEFAELSRAVRDAGLMARRRGSYPVRIAATVGALGVLGAGLLWTGHSWWGLALAPGFAFVFAQLGFLGHDAGHRQVSGSRRTNDLVGLVVADLLTGFSFGWWLKKHSLHHAHANQPGKDPDLAPGALVYTREQRDRRMGLGRWLARFQGVLVVPLLFLEAVNLHVAGIRFVARRHDRASRGEAALLTVHGLVFLVGPVLVMGLGPGLVFVAVTQGLFGLYLGSTFLTNHVGMPTLDGSGDLGFLRRQVLTARNLEGSKFTGFVFGGLDTQIEHHLFPAMPRSNLRRARKVVQPFCVERGIAYVEQRPWQAYRDVFGASLECRGSPQRGLSMRPGRA